MRFTRIMVADGGFGTQITEYVGQKFDDDPLWSSRFITTNTSAVINTHMDFLRSGADFISTNTYQATNDLLEGAVKLAKAAKEMYVAEAKIKPDKGFPMIVASIGPFGAHLRDGSEYTGNYADKVSPQQIVDFQRPRLDACLEAGVDALAIETIPNQMEAEAMVQLLCTEYHGVKFWISFQCKDEESLAHGENFAKAALSVWQILKEHKAQENCLAIGVNCVQPKFVTSLFNALNGNRSPEDQIPLVVYPNSGEVYDASKGCWVGKELCVPLAGYVPEWAALGVKIIGGCCRAYASDIARIAEVVSRVNEAA